LPHAAMSVPESTMPALTESRPRSVSENSAGFGGVPNVC
jgi:hypothetical protein